jgi:ketosteroid isomerase-like protein
MSATTDTEQVLRAYLDALVAGDLDRIAASFAEDATWSLHGDLPLSGTKRGRAAVMDFLVGAGALFAPGTQSFTFGEVTVQDDRAVLEWNVRGVGAATGKPYDNDYCGVFVIRDGRIVAVREYLDTGHAATALFGPRQ